MLLLIDISHLSQAKMLFTVLLVLVLFYIISKFIIYSFVKIILSKSFFFYFCSFLSISFFLLRRTQGNKAIAMDNKICIFLLFYSYPYILKIFWSLVNHTIYIYVTKKKCSRQAGKWNIVWICGTSSYRVVQ